MNEYLCSLEEYFTKFREIVLGPQYWAVDLSDLYA